MPRAYNIGDIVAIEFLDHSTGDEILPFTVFGRVSIITADSITVDTWTYTDRRHDRDENVESYTIVKSAMQTVTRLKPADWSADGGKRTRPV